jgi:hypothetical protein
MSKNIILILMYHRHKLLDLIYEIWNFVGQKSVSKFTENTGVK